MDPKITLLLAQLAGLAGTQLLPVLIAPLASLLASGFEKLPVFPYQGRTKGGIVVALLTAALVVRVALAWVFGTPLSLEDWTIAVKLIIDAVLGAGVAAGGYAVVHAAKPALPWRKHGGGNYRA